LNLRFALLASKIIRILPSFFGTKNTATSSCGVVVQYSSPRAARSFTNLT